MIQLLRRRQPVEPERPKLDKTTKNWYREVVTVESPLAAFFPPGQIEDERKARFFVMQCPHCKCIHTAACPAVKSIEQYENGNVKRVVFNEDWDTSLVITFEDVFSDDPDDEA